MKSSTYKTLGEIYIDCHVVRVKCLQGVMKLLPVSSDLFTKALKPQPCKCNHLISKLGMVNICQSLAWGSYDTVS